jgi:hypothetical protein
VKEMQNASEKQLMVIKPNYFSFFISQAKSLADPHQKQLHETRQPTKHVIKIRIAKQPKELQLKRSTPKLVTDTYLWQNNLVLFV